MTWQLPLRSFVLALGLLAAASGACAQRQAALLKEHRYVQTDGASAREDSSRPAWRFHALADASAAGWMFAAPGDSPQPLVLSPLTGDYEFTEEFPVESALDSIFPDGTFTVGGDGRRIPVRLGGSAYPAAPLAEPSAGRWEGGVLVVDPAQTETLTLRFHDGYVPGGAYLEIAVVQQTSGGTGYVGRVSSSGAAAIDFNLQQLALTIPANTLAEGATCRVELVLYRCSSVDQTSVSGIAIVGGFAATTTFLLKAEGTGATPMAPAPPYRPLVGTDSLPGALTLR